MAAKKQTPKGKTVPAKKTLTARRKPAAAPKATVKAKKPVKGWVAPGEAKPEAVRALTATEERFALEYIIDLNATQAYLRANPGVKETTAATEGSKYLGNPKIAAAIQKAKDERAERTGITADRALKEVWGILTADARELVEYRRGCCRFCWGVNFDYQRTARELERDRLNHTKEVAEGSARGDFNEAGGAGFNANKPPHKDCPECFGDGHGRVILKDTRTFSKEAASIYAGVKQTKEGLEVKFHSKGDAAEKMFKHLGLYEVDNKQKTDPLRDLLQGLGGKSAFPVVTTTPAND